MPSSVSIPAEMTRSPDPQQGEPAANPAAAAAGTAAGQTKRTRAARNIPPTGPLIAIIVLLAGAVGGLVLRDLNRLDAGIVRLDAEVAQLRVDMNAGFADVDARFDEFESDVDARFDEFESDMDARFDEFESDMDAGFDDVDARFDSLEAGQAEIARTLAVLVAGLNARASVDAALEGRLLAPDADTAEPPSTEP